MKHQHNKKIKISITSLIDLLLCNEAGNLIDECIPSFNAVANDKNKDTRKIFLNKIAELLKKLNSIYLKKYEGKLFVLLLTGISDEDEDKEIPEEVRIRPWSSNEWIVPMLEIFEHDCRNVPITDYNIE